MSGSVLLTFDEDLSSRDVLKDVAQAFESVLIESPRRAFWARHALAAGDAEVVREEISAPPGLRAKPLALPIASDDGRRWYALELDSIFAECDSKSSGLSSRAATERLAARGLNVLEPPKKPSALSQLLGQFMNVPVALLGASAVLSLATGGVGDAVAIGVVVVLNATIGYVTERQAERTLSMLGQAEEEPATVLRDGAAIEISSKYVAVGDVLILKPGDVVAADARLLDADHLMVDESSLTGESVPADKSLDLIEDDIVPLADRDNMVYRGTTVSGGSGRAIVVATGRDTEIGRIQTLAGALEARETPLQGQLRRLGFDLVIGSAAVCGGVFVIGLLRGHRLIDMVKTSVSLAVAAVPEGLPTVAITTLALGIRRMRELDVVVRHLGAVETLGALQVLCLDKTGTITQNRMTVVAIHVNERTFHVHGKRFFDESRAISPETNSELMKLLEIVALCSEVELNGNGASPEPGGDMTGSPTERALVETSLAAGIDVRALRKRLPRQTIGYRTSSRNYMYTVHTLDGDDFVAVKGSPGEVLTLCDRQSCDGDIRPLDEDARLVVETENERMASDSLRVLGVALRQGSARDLDESASSTPSGFVWLGLVGMVDPPRENIAELLEQFHAAGIATVMITGDQSATAHSVAKQIRLGPSDSLQILDSTRLDRLEPDVLRSLAERVDIFSRVSPTHKLQIVRALQATGKIVAMTGDGINDGPALKAADVGVALGQTGTTAAREVADVVLTTDDLHAMITAVEQGRTIYDDIRKALRFILATNLSEILVTFTTVAGGLGQPLTPMQLLWINLLSDVFPELALAVQPPEHDVLARPPRDPSAPIFSRSDLITLLVEGSIITSGAMAAYAYGLARYGVGPRASTLAFTSLTSAQLLHAFSARSENHSIFEPAELGRNPYVPISIGAGLGLQFLAAVFPPLRKVLGTTKMGASDWVVAGFGATGPFVMNELLKLGRRARLDARSRARPRVRAKGGREPDAT